MKPVGMEKQMLGLDVDRNTVVGNLRESGEDKRTDRVYSFLIFKRDPGLILEFVERARCVNEPCGISGAAYLGIAVVGGV